jgi:TonB family protein
LLCASYLVSPIPLLFLRFNSHTFMKKLFILPLFLAYATYSQIIFQVQEVDKPAEPQGGVAFLQQFVLANLQVPFQTRIQQLKGRVFVSGIVETDGSVSDLKVAKGISPISDAEALRVVGLYRAWKPALKENKPVRQAFNFAVVFPDTPINNYDSTSHSLIDFFNEKFQFTQDPNELHFRRSIPVDKNGVLTGNVVFEELKKKQWKPYFSATFRKKPLMYKINNDFGTPIDSIPAYRITAQDDNWNSYVPEMIFQENGKLLSTAEYQGFKVVNYSHYYPNGALKEQLMVDGNNQRVIKWYNNGQIAEIIEREAPEPTKPNKEKIISIWSKSGKQYVKEGNGWATESLGLITHGLVQNGYKEGRWTAKLADSTLYMDELYEAGVLKLGTIYDKGEVRNYTEAEINAQFKGGLAGLGMFLAKNIKYPKEAAKSNISGKVYLSFVVCEDGSLCNYEILKGIGGGCDEEALRVVKESSGKWEPGLQYGKKVRVKYNLPVSFILE